MPSKAPNWNGFSGNVETQPAAVACPDSEFLQRLTVWVGVWPTNGGITTVNGMRFGCATATVPVSEDHSPPADGNR